MTRGDLLVVLLVLVVDLLGVGVGDRQRGLDLLHLGAGDEVLAHEVELLDDVGVILQVVLHALIGQQLHAEVVLGELLLALAHGELLILIGQRLDGCLEFRLPDLDVARGDDHRVGFLDHDLLVRRCGRRRGRLLVLREDGGRRERKRNGHEILFHRCSLFLAGWIKVAR